jgi:hypothetical protein
MHQILGPLIYCFTNCCRPNKTGGFFKIETRADFFCFQFQNAYISMETFCCRDVLLQETLCYGDIMLRKCFVWRRSVQEMFCAETFCMYAILSPL